MKSSTTQRFRKLFSSLPDDIQKKARRAYQMFERDALHPSLRFKKVHAQQPIYSVRIDPAYRALGIKADDAIVWFWIGSHDDYERLLSEL